VIRDALPPIFSHVSPDDPPPNNVAVLVSGGIDSAILCVDLLGGFARVFPLYVRFKLRWEEVELASLRRFLGVVARPGLMPLHVLDEPITAVYGDHWSVDGSDVPGAETPDESVYLPGRNLLLGGKAAVWCRLRGIEALAFGCLRANPFPDSTPEFFQGLESVANRAMGGRLRIVRPYERLDKAAVLLRGAGLPLHLTFSCLNPVAGRHCGACNKCAERRNGFRALGWPDRTAYATAPAARSRV
jgi:7-cyano-7-deazaguanine synthase